MRRALLALLAIAACTDDVRVGQPLRRVLDVPPARPTALDVLFVVDPAADADASAARAALVAAAGDALFGELEHRLGALPDLHVGVISSEVAQGGLPVGCDGAHVGELSAGAGGCTTNGGRFLASQPAGDNPVRNFADLGAAFTCLASLPPSTCEVSQPIAATRAALVDHPPDVNRDFVRADAMLLIVFVTSRDDCSSDQPSFYNPGEFGSTPLDSRCFAAAARCAGGACVPRDDGVLASIPDVAAALRKLKPDDDSLVMVAGVFAPPTTSGMIDRGGGDLVPASPCGARAAVPGVRLSALAGEFTSRYAYASICDGGAADQLRTIADGVARVLDRSHCVLGPLRADSPCRAFAKIDKTLAPIPSCADSGGDCFRLAPAPACADTASGLAASPDMPPDRAHLVVECAAPAGL
jgi:hypothetical protein